MRFSTNAFVFVFFFFFSWEQSDVGASKGTGNNFALGVFRLFATRRVER